MKNVSIKFTLVLSLFVVGVVNAAEATPSLFQRVGYLGSRLASLVGLTERFPLHRAVQENDLEAVSSLLAQVGTRIALNERDNRLARTALHYAAENGHLAAAMMLIFAGEDPYSKWDAECKSVFNLAKKHRVTEAQVRLLRAQLESKTFPCLVASSKGPSKEDDAYVEYKYASFEGGALDELIYRGIIEPLYIPPMHEPQIMKNATFCRSYRYEQHEMGGDLWENQSGIRALFLHPRSAISYIYKCEGCTHVEILYGREADKLPNPENMLILYSRSRIVEACFHEYFSLLMRRRKEALDEYVAFHPRTLRLYSLGDIERLQKGLATYYTTKDYPLPDDFMDEYVLVRKKEAPMF